MKDGKPVPALKAGGHLDPENKGVHLGPYNKEGHLGDLPGLVANSQGDADYAVLAPRLTKLDQIKDKALMVHVGEITTQITQKRLAVVVLEWHVV